MHNRNALRHARGYRLEVTALEGRSLMTIAPIAGVGPAVIVNDAPEIPSGPLTVMVTAESDMVTGTSTVLTATIAGRPPFLGDVNFHFTTISVPRGAYTPTIEPVSRFNLPGEALVTFGTTGAYTFEVTAVDKTTGQTGTAQVNVTVAQTRSINVQPTSSKLPDGRSEQLFAQVVDQFGTSLGDQTIYWGIVPGGVGSVNPLTGLYTAPAIGGGLTIVAAATTSGLVGAAQISVDPSLFPDIRVNFTSDPAQTPTGYLTDSGQSFRSRPGVLAYGWNRTNVANAADRDNPDSPDELHDSFVAMQGRTNPNASWSIDLPSGVYQVHLLAGDPNTHNSVYRMNVNGVLALSGKPTAANHWVDATVTVRLTTTSKLTVSNARGARNSKLDAIDIVAASPFAAPTAKTPAGPRAIRARR